MRFKGVSIVRIYCTDVKWRDHNIKSQLCCADLYIWVQLNSKASLQLSDLQIVDCLKLRLRDYIFTFLEAAILNI